MTQLEKLQEELEVATYEKNTTAIEHLNYLIQQIKNN